MRVFFGGFRRFSAPPTGFDPPRNFGGRVASGSFKNHMFEYVGKPGFRGRFIDRADVPPTLARRLAASSYIFL